jgi:hypothetical protein
MLLACVLALMVCGGTVQAAATDQPSSWAATSVSEARNLKLATDEMDTAFQSPTTRAEFCRLIIRWLVIFYDAPIDSQIETRGLTPQDFNDTDDYAIRAAAALEITSGTGNGDFSPNQELTREQAATMLRNALNAIGINTADSASVAWSDAGEIADWARSATNAVYAAKIMNGTNADPLTFSPQSPYTHEQAVVTALNLWEYAIGQDASRSLPKRDIEYGEQPSKPAESPKAAIQVNQGLLSTYGSSYGKIRDLFNLSDPEFLYHGEYCATDAKTGVSYYFTNSNWEAQDNDMCLKIGGGLNSIVSGISEEMPVDEFADRLMSLGDKASYKIEKGAGTSGYIADRYAVVYFSGDDGSGEDGSGFGAALYIALPENGADTVSPNSGTWLQIIAG